jgi:hypothetical protein
MGARVQEIDRVRVPKTDLVKNDIVNIRKPGITRSRLRIGLHY